MRYHEDLVKSFLDYDLAYIDLNKLSYRMGRISDEDAAGFGALGGQTA